MENIIDGLLSTERLFDDDAYAAEFDAEALYCAPTGSIENADKIFNTTGGFVTVLDRTLFFPEGGGQSADGGEINGEKIIDVKEINGVIFHLSEKAFEKGEKVHGKIDFKERYRRMQNHSGEHILSGYVCGKWKYNNVGFHLSEEYVRIDFDGVLDEKDIEEIEAATNNAIVENHMIKAWYPDAETVSAMEYRSKKDICGKIRIVEIEGIDICACCAPHVRSTAEVGSCKIVDFMKYKGGTRMFIKCGGDASALFTEEHKILTDISHFFSAKREEAFDCVLRQSEEIKQLKYQLVSAKKELMKNKLETVENTDGNLLFFFENEDMNSVREFINEAVKKCGKICFAFTGNDTDGYRYIAASKTVDLKACAKEINEKICGRGGGSPEMIQGNATANRKTIEANLN